MAVRVFHPTLNAFEDVADDRVGEWVEQGWLKSKPKHVDDSNALPPVVTNSAKGQAVQENAQKK